MAALVSFHHRVEREVHNFLIGNDRVIHCEEIVRNGGERGLQISFSRSPNPLDFYGKVGAALANLFTRTTPRGRRAFSGVPV